MTDNTENSTENSNTEYHPLREVIYEYFKEHCESVPRWYQPFFDWEDAAEALDVPTVGDIPKPYGVVVLAGEDMTSELSVGFQQPVEVWVYFRPGNYIPLDKACREIIKLLNDKLIEYEGKHVLMQYQGNVGDSYDSDLKAIFNRLDFNVPRVRTR